MAYVEIIVMPFNVYLFCYKAAPFWLDKPENLILAPGENGRLVCRANGNPKPSVQWLVNGEPIESKKLCWCEKIMFCKSYGVFLKFMTVVEEKEHEIFSSNYRSNHI